MFTIGKVAIEYNIAVERFMCDLKRCRGGCCTLSGGRGAPLLNEEVQEIENSYPQVVRYLPEKHIEIIRRYGLVEGSPDNFATVCVDHKACVFVYYDGDIAHCAFEKGYLEGTTKWRKPLSCHLFPIRIQYGVVDYLHYERIRECESGRESGRVLDVSLVSFLRDALIRKYGNGWYSMFISRCAEISNL